MKAIARLPALSNVVNSACNVNPAPTGRHACYLVDPEERTANLAEFDEILVGWEQSHVRAWFGFLENSSEHTIDLQQMLFNILGQNIPDIFSSMTADDFKAAIGAAERSLEDENGELGDDELRPIFDWVDQNGDGTLSLSERTLVLRNDCSAQARDDDTTNMCDVYVELLMQFVPSFDVTYDEWKEELLSEGASVHEEISAQFSAW
eukprot:CAMPEP_0196161272 /NCGR_PEP_ID=MMETSP0910-20130528/47249_1 /TAXON_ID=49265 /ORGANISM="Thalassiosira rotula, Strain GSO102" /LENGTH=205 /DNA_ID=CAMNT_0041426213 /DNA_START=70 /DNA_END=684 /DNA_ORIENTATION=+